jgi:hypothetical protein
MSEIELIPEQERLRVETLRSPEYQGKLTAALEPGETVVLATMGRINTNHISDKAGRGKPALLTVTDRRVLAVLPRGKSLFGKKDPAPISMGFGNIFEAGTLVHSRYEVIVQICGPAPKHQTGPYIIWKLDTGYEHAEGYGDVWAVTIKDLAEAAGGTRNRPHGL